MIIIIDSDKCSCGENSTCTCPCCGCECQCTSDEEMTQYERSILRMKKYFEEKNGDSKNK